MKLCPFCAEEIQDAAIKCKHCGSMLDQKPIDSVTSVATDKARIRLDPDSTRMLVGLLVTAAAGYGAFHLISHDSGWGWVLVVLAIAALAVALMRQFKCSYCAHVNGVAIYADNHECAKCKVLHVIDWE